MPENFQPQQPEEPNQPKGKELLLSALPLIALADAGSEGDGTNKILAALVLIGIVVAMAWFNRDKDDPPNPPRRSGLGERAHDFWWYHMGGRERTAEEARRRRWKEIDDRPDYGQHQ